MLLSPVQVMGLCGTYSWNIKDDFMTTDGNVEANANKFAESFQKNGN